MQQASSYPGEMCCSARWNRQNAPLFKLVAMKNWKVQASMMISGMQDIIMALSSDGWNASGDLTLFDDSGQIIADVEGLSLKRVNISRLLQMATESMSNLLYEIRWQVEDRQPHITSQGEDSPGFWLILADKGGVGTALAQQF